MVKHWPGDHMVPMFTNCQIKEDTQLDHHVNLQIYLKTRSLGTSGPINFDLPKNCNLHHSEQPLPPESCHSCWPCQNVIRTGFRDISLNGSKKDMFK